MYNTIKCFPCFLYIEHKVNIWFTIIQHYEGMHIWIKELVGLQVFLLKWLKLYLWPMGVGIWIHWYHNVNVQWRHFNKKSGGAEAPHFQFDHKYHSYIISAHNYPQNSLNCAYDYSVSLKRWKEKEGVKAVKGMDP